jgi:hypothetical protein
MFLKETQLFLFNDLFLFCRPRKKGNLLDIVFEISPDKIRAKIGESDSFMLRLLRDGGPDVTTKYVFQCKDFVEQEGWMEVFDKINPYTKLSQRKRARNPAILAIALELEWTGSRHTLIENQAALLGERLQMIKLKQGKLKAASDASKEELLGKFSTLAYSLPQWKYQAKELKQLCETTLEWLKVLAPHAKYSKKLEQTGEGGEVVTLVSLRKHQQTLKDQKKAAAESPPPLPERCEEDYEEFEEYEEEEYEDEDDGFDLDKLASVLRDVEAKNPSPAKPGPDGVKKKRRMVKRKVKRKKKKNLAPRPPGGSGSLPSSAPNSPAVGRKGPGAPRKPVPPPPTIPDYPTENLTVPVQAEIDRFTKYVAQTMDIYNGYKEVEKEMNVKVEALEQLTQIK